MKKLLFLLLVISSAAYSQNVIQKKETVSKILTGNTWIVDYGMMNGLKIEKLGQMKPLKYVFKADNTYTLNETKSGKWQYNAKKKSVELFLDGAIKSTIIKLQSKSMVMTLNADKTAPKGVADLQIFFKPKG